MSDDVNELEIEDAFEGDSLPEDLDISELTGIYEFPNNSKRKVASVLYLAIGGICIAAAASSDSSLVNRGVLLVGIGLVIFAIYSFVIAVDTHVDEGEALASAAAVTGFAVGPAAAQMIWRGWRSRPAWRVLVYSTEPQPEKRAIVVVDAVDGSVIEHLVEDNPEDWSALQR